MAVRQLRALVVLALALAAAMVVDHWAILKLQRPMVRKEIIKEPRRTIKVAAFFLPSLLPFILTLAFVRTPFDSLLPFLSYAVDTGIGLAVFDTSFARTVFVAPFTRICAVCALQMAQ